MNSGRLGRLSLSYFCGAVILPGELAKHAVSEGTKAVTKFEAATNKK